MKWSIQSNRFYLLCLLIISISIISFGQTGGRLTCNLSGEDWTIVSVEPGIGEKLGYYDANYSSSPRAIAAKVPGDIHWDLERSGDMPDIYFGLNSLDVFGVPGKEWWYRKSFIIGEEWKGKQVRLKFEAVDYATKVWLNGEFLGAHQGQFTPFEFDVTEVVKIGHENVLSVLIEAPPENIVKLLSSGKHQDFHDEISRTMKFWKSRVVSGWDFGIPLWSMGIWQDVWLLGSDGVYIDEILVFPETSYPYDQARIKTKVKIHTKEFRDCRMVYRVRCVTAEVTEVNEGYNAPVYVGEQVLEFPVDISRPKLWWPNGYGKPNLYELTVTVKDLLTGEALDEMTVRFGIRNLEILVNPKSEGRKYMDYWHDGGKGDEVTGWKSGIKELPGDKEQKYLISVNGKRIFARGGNILPTDMMFGRSGRCEYEHLIRLAAMGNYNVFRIWGGGLIEKQIFYDLCDEYGIMVWQDMPNAGALPLETPEALANYAIQQRKVMGLLVNHPCIVRYTFGNELYRNRENSYQVAQFEDICREIDPTRPAYAASPVTTAQRHAPWYFSFPPGGPGSDGNPEGWPDAYAIYNTGINMHAGPENPVEWTEYGASGLSSVETLKRIIPADRLWPVGENDYWHHHNAPATSWWLMSQIYRPLFKELKDLDTEVRVSQFAQAEGLRYANQSHRRHKWHRSACVSWTFNEPWPNAAHGSIVEYYGLPKMAYYYSRDSYSEVDISAEYGALYVRSGEPLGMKLFVTSDRKQELKNSQVTAKVVDLDGRVLGLQEWKVDVAAKENTSVGDVTFIPSAKLEGRVILVMVELYTSNGERVSGHTYTFGVIGADNKQPIPEGYMNNLLTSRQTNLEISATPGEIQEWYGKKTRMHRVTVRNAGKTPALFIKLNANNAPNKAVYIEDNYFTLLAGEDRNVNVFIPDDEDPDVTGVIQLSAKSWNSNPVSERLYK